MEYLISAIRMLFALAGFATLIGCIALRGDVANMTDDGIVVWLAAWGVGIALLAIAILW